MIYTTKRLNLDAFRIRNERKREIRRIRMELELRTEKEQQNFLNALFDETKDELNPYFSTIKDNFGFMLL